jgi:hypothetical protein
MTLLDGCIKGIGAAERKAQAAAMKPQRIAEFKWRSGFDTSIRYDAEFIRLQRKFVRWYKRQAISKIDTKRMT